MSTARTPLKYGQVLMILAAATCTQASCSRKLLDEPTWRKRYEATTQADAYSSAQGQNPGGPGDAFTWNGAESSATSNYNGVYYGAGQKVVEAGDLAKAGWSGAYSKNGDLGTTSSVSAVLDSEFATQRGTHTVSGTYEGARAVAGSGSNFGLSNDPGSVATWTMDSYSQTAEKSTAVGDRRRSVAFTGIAPQSTAQAGIGSGPAAIATGWQVSAAARSHRDKIPPVTVGSRDSGDALQTSVYGRQLHQLQQALPQMGRRLSRQTRSEKRPHVGVPKKQGTDATVTAKRAADVKKATGSVVGRRQLLQRGQPTS